MENYYKNKDNRYYRYLIDGIYGVAVFYSNFPIEIIDYDENKNLVMTRISLARCDSYYKENKKVIVSDNNCDYNFHVYDYLDTKYGTPDGITMDMYFNMVMSRKNNTMIGISELNRKLNIQEQFIKNTKEELECLNYKIRKR